MTVDNFEFWKNIVFRTKVYYNNYDNFIDSDGVITEHSGMISDLRINEGKPPIPIGEFSMSIWNISLCKLLNVNIFKLISDLKLEETYRELDDLIKYNSVYERIINSNKLIIIHSIVLKQDYRKRELTDEFFEIIYRNYYDENTIILALVKPFQKNAGLYNYLMDVQTIKVNNSIKNPNDFIKYPASTYYSLNSFLDKKDHELNKYKLFSIAAKNGFSRINESNLFEYSPNKTIDRLLQKHKKINSLWKILN
jgi:hypothetical protein